MIKQTFKSNRLENQEPTVLVVLTKAGHPKIVTPATPQEAFQKPISRFYEMYLKGRSFPAPGESLKLLLGGRQ
jgi:hypothetical protein